MPEILFAKQEEGASGREFLIRYLTIFVVVESIEYLVHIVSTESCANVTELWISFVKLLSSDLSTMALIDLSEHSIDIFHLLSAGENI